MKEIEELKLYNQIVTKYTDLFLILDDCVEDDKSGELEEFAQVVKGQITNLVKKTEFYGVDVSSVVCFEDISRCKNLRQWYDECKQELVNEQVFEQEK